MFKPTKKVKFHWRWPVAMTTRMKEADECDWTSPWITNSKHDPQSHSTEDTCVLLTDTALPLFCLHSNSSIIWLCTWLTSLPWGLSSIFKVNLFRLRLDCGHLLLHEWISVWRKKEKEERKKDRGTLSEKVGIMCILAQWMVTCTVHTGGREIIAYYPSDRAESIENNRNTLQRSHSQCSI